jgi:glycosyltransferase involved in cell wall biosynthesis
MDEKPAALFDAKHTLFLSWSYSRRSEDIAALLGIPYRFFPLSQKRRLFQFPLLFLKTLLFLFRTRPSVVFVQHPPVHILFPVLVYYLLCGVRFIIDSHITPGTTLVEKPHHRCYLLLHRFYSFFAEVTLFHSRAILERSVEWSGNFMVLENPVRELALRGSYKVEHRPAVGMVTSFSPDEHVEEVTGAARKLPEVSFYITGSEEKIPPALKTDLPLNVVFTGYISGISYYEFLHAMDLVIVLTDRPESALLGAYESIAAETPLVVSDTETMRECIPQGAAFVENNVESIRSGVEAGLVDREKLKTEIVKLRRNKLEQQQRTFRAIALTSQR